MRGSQGLTTGSPELAPVQPLPTPGSRRALELTGTHHLHNPHSTREQTRALPHPLHQEEQTSTPRSDRAEGCSVAARWDQRAQAPLRQHPCHRHAWHPLQKEGTEYP